MTTKVKPKNTILSDLSFFNSPEEIQTFIEELKAEKDKDMAGNIAYYENLLEDSINFHKHGIVPGFR